MVRRIILLMLITCLTYNVQAQEQKYQLSSHILDVSKGMPAANVLIQLEVQNSDKSWKVISEKRTDKDGRIGDFLPLGAKENHGIYRLTYFTEPYFKSLNQQSFYPFIEVVFEIKDGQHYHVPITLSAYGYATYRGN